MWRDCTTWRGRRRLCLCTRSACGRMSKNRFWGTCAAEMASLSNLDEAACARIVDWRLGWTTWRSTGRALVAGGAPDVTIVDFSSVQADGGAALREAASLPAWRISYAGAAAVRWCAHKERWDDGSWARWYGGPCFAHDRSAAIQKPLKAPLPSSALPPF